MRATVLLIGVALMGCGQADRAPIAAPTDTIGIPADPMADLEKAANVSVENERLAARVSELEKRLAAKPKAGRANVKVAEPGRPPVEMCYKDYCPCDQPQEGMDSILCDQLEAGVEVDVRSMIAGRGAREYRRQVKDLGF